MTNAVRAARTLDRVGVQERDRNVPDGGVPQPDRDTKGETMNISITFGVAMLAFAATATGCATVAGGGGVYLVGVAGGG